MIRCIVNDAWGDSFENLAGVFQSGDCISEPNRYPTPPSSQITGVLAEVVRGGSLRMGSAKGTDRTMESATLRFVGKVLKEIGIACALRHHSLAAHSLGMQTTRSCDLTSSCSTRPTKSSQRSIAELCT